GTGPGQAAPVPGVGGTGRFRPGKGHQGGGLMITYRVMEEGDIGRVVPFYMEYYNTHDGDGWTQETTYRRIHQVWSREDSYCLLMEEDGVPIGFAMGYLVQFHDISAYDLAEIVVDGRHQGRG